MSEIRVTSVVGENGGDRVGLTTGLTVGPLTGTTGIGATITHQGHAQFAGVCTATSFVGNGAGLTNVSAGKILQVVNLVKTDSFSTTSTSLVDITGFSLSITPQFNNSKIMVLASGYISNQGNNHGVHLFFYRTRSGQSDVEVGKSYNQKATVQSQTGGTFVIQNLDSPATTSAITYKIKVKSSNGQTVTFNRSYRDTNLAAYDGRAVSFLTVMEISG